MSDWNHTCYSCSNNKPIQVFKHYNALWDRYELFCGILEKKPPRRFKVPFKSKDWKECKDYKHDGKYIYYPEKGPYYNNIDDRDLSEMV